MDASDIPVKISLPFASSATPGTYTRQVPTPSQLPTHPNDASFTDGFPPNTFVSIGAGGAGPDGRDVNGVLNQMSAWNLWQAAGGPVQHDATFSAAIGGYPQGAWLAAETLGLFWLSLVDDNTTDPDLGGTGWQQFGAIGPTTGVGGLLYTLQPTAPANFFLADGSAVLQASYPALYSIIGKKYTTFSVSDHATGGACNAEAFCAVGGTLHVFGFNVGHTRLQDNFTTDLASWTHGAQLTTTANAQTAAVAVYDGSSLIVFDTKAGVYSVNTSTGAITLVTTTGLALTKITCAVVVGSTIIVGGSTTSGTVPALAYSTDHGVTWTSITVPGNSASTIFSLATDGANVVASYDFSYKNHIIYSATGTSGYTDVNLTSIGFDGTVGDSGQTLVQCVNGQFFYFVGQSGMVAARSTNSSTWSAFLLPQQFSVLLAGNAINGIIYVNGVYAINCINTWVSTTDFQTYCTFPVPIAFGSNLSPAKAAVYFTALGVWVGPGFLSATDVASAAPNCNLTTQFQLPNAVETATPVTLQTANTDIIGSFSPMSVTTTAPYGNTPLSWQPFIYIRVQ